MTQSILVQAIYDAGTSCRYMNQRLPDGKAITKHAKGEDK
jgi:hypothetical protein